MNNMNIVKKIYYVAKDEDGNIYSLKNFDIKDSEEIIQHNVEGNIITEEIQDRYENGEYARSYSEISYFELKK